MKVEIKKQESAGNHWAIIRVTYVVYLVTGDMQVAKGMFKSKSKATKEAKRVALVYGCEIEK
jgi:hypothetical protein